LAAIGNWIAPRSRAAAAGVHAQLTARACARTAWRGSAGPARSATAAAASAGARRAANAARAGGAAAPPATARRAARSGRAGSAVRWRTCDARAAADVTSACAGLAAGTPNLIRRAASRAATAALSARRAGRAAAAASASATSSCSACSAGRCTTRFSSSVLVSATRGPSDAALATAARLASSRSDCS